MLPITDDEDDVRSIPSNDVLPADAILTENRVIEVFHGERGKRCHRVHCALKPLTGKFSSNHRGIEADDLDLVLPFNQVGLIGSSIKTRRGPGVRGRGTTFSSEFSSIPKSLILGGGKLFHHVYLSGIASPL